MYDPRVFANCACAENFRVAATADPRPRAPIAIPRVPHPARLARIPPENPHRIVAAVDTDAVAVVAACVISRVIVRTTLSTVRRVVHVRMHVRRALPRGRPRRDVAIGIEFWRETASRTGAETLLGKMSPLRDASPSTAFRARDDADAMDAARAEMERMRRERDARRARANGGAVASTGTKYARRGDLARGGSTAVEAEEATRTRWDGDGRTRRR